MTSSIGFPFQIDHLNLSTGARQPWRALNGDSTGVRLVSASLPRSGSPIAYMVRQFQSELWIASGIR